MDDATPENYPEGELTPRMPSLEDVLDLCRELNRQGAKYIIIGGFAVRAAGYVRETTDIDFLIDIAPENEAKVFKALEILPDQAVLELDPGDVEKYNVVRIADEVTVDLMKAACGIAYSEASEMIVFYDIEGVRIPFASPELLWKTKHTTHREKDAGDLAFLRRLIEASGGKVPE